MSQIGSEWFSEASLPYFPEIPSFHAISGLTSVISVHIEFCVKSCENIRSLVSSDFYLSDDILTIPYNRSGSTGLDYAVNRTYNSGQSRFIQVDPIGMASASIGKSTVHEPICLFTKQSRGFIDPSGTILLLPNTIWTESRYPRNSHIKR